MAGVLPDFHCFLSSEYGHASWSEKKTGAHFYALPEDELALSGPFGRLLYVASCANKILLDERVFVCHDQDEVADRTG